MDVGLKGSTLQIRQMLHGWFQMALKNTEILLDECVRNQFSVLGFSTTRAKEVFFSNCALGVPSVPRRSYYVNIGLLKL